MQEPGADEHRVDFGDAQGAEVADPVQPLIQIEAYDITDCLRVGLGFPDAVEDPGRDRPSQAGNRACRPDWAVSRRAREGHGGVRVSAVIMWLFGGHLLAAG